MSPQLLFLLGVVCVYAGTAIIGIIFLYLEKRRKKMSDTKPKLDLTKPIQRRNGEKIEYVRLLKGERKWQILAIGARADGYEELTTHLIDGSADDSKENGLDLINVPEKRVVWVYECPNGDLGISNLKPTWGGLLSHIRLEFESGRKDE